MANTNTLTGTVRSFDNKKAYGFIRVEGNPEDIFVHQRQIRMEGYRSLDAGDTVEFRLRRDERGLSAYDVTRIHAVTGTTSAEKA